VDNQTSLQLALTSEEEGDDMATRKKNRKKSAHKPRARRVISRTVVPSVELRGVEVPEPVTDVVTEKAYITTEPEVEIRKPGTLAQALTEPAEVVVKPKTSVRRVRTKTRRVA
jgi:cell envelope opacity-associated protein A